MNSSSAWTQHIVSHQKGVMLHQCQCTLTDVRYKWQWLKQKRAIVLRRLLIAVIAKLNSDSQCTQSLDEGIEANLVHMPVTHETPEATAAFCKISSGDDMVSTRLRCWQHLAVVSIFLGLKAVTSTCIKQYEGMLCSNYDIQLHNGINVDATLQALTFLLHVPSIGKDQSEFLMQSRSGYKYGT